MRKQLVYGLSLLLLAVLLALAWWGWTKAGLSLLQLDGFICQLPFATDAGYSA